MKSVEMSTKGSVYLDEFLNVRYSSDFELVLGNLTPEFRFIPNTKIVVEQGLSLDMLEAISELIKDKVENQNFNNIK